MNILFLMISLVLGVALGYLFVRNRPIIKGFVNCSTTVTICLLIFTMGLAVGFNKDLLSKIGSLGWQSMVIALFAMMGSVLVAGLFFKFVADKK